jgi:hypothetical protein
LYNRPEVAAVPNGFSPTPLIIKNKKINVTDMVFATQRLRLIRLNTHSITLTVGNS